MANKSHKGLAKKWSLRLEKEKKAHSQFRKDAQASVDAARDDGKKVHAFNIHWANCNIVHSAVYARPPKPDVRRRFHKSPDEDERNLARMIERGLEFNKDTNEFEVNSHAVVDDFVKTGLGVPRVIYDVVTEPMPDILTDAEQARAGMMAAFEEKEPDPTFDQGLEEITLQAVGIKFWPWKHFHWEPGHSDWDDVGWVCFDTFMSKEDAEAEYGMELKAGSDSGETKRKAEEYADEICVHEVWDKKNKRVIEFTIDHDEVLRVREDPLELRRFFPCPRPAMANTKGDELIPKADFCFIEKQVEALNRVTQRRHQLVKHIKAVRLYDSMIAEHLQKLENAPDAANVPIDNMAAMLESSGGQPSLEKLLVELPMADRIQTIMQLDEQADSLKEQIYETIGIADIVRGASKATETATAQSIKGQWANVRLNNKTSEVNRIWRDVFRIQAEIMCERFTDEQLFLMTGIEVTPRMREMMSNDVTRMFAIDVETDSTILADEQEERAQKTEVVNVILERLGQILPYVQQALLPAEVMQELLLFSVQGYKHSKQLEEAVYQILPGMMQLQDVRSLQGQVQQLHGQLQEQGEQWQKEFQRIQGEAQKAVTQAQGEAGKAIEQARAQQAQIDWAESRREDMLAEAEANQKNADADKTRAEADALVVDTQVIKRLEAEHLGAETDKTEAETDKLDAETEQIRRLENVVDEDERRTIQ